MPIFSQSQFNLRIAEAKLHFKPKILRLPLALHGVKILLFVNSLAKLTRARNNSIWLTTFSLMRLSQLSLFSVMFKLSRNWEIDFKIRFQSLSKFMGRDAQDVAAVFKS